MWGRYLMWKFEPWFWVGQEFLNICLPRMEQVSCGQRLRIRDWACSSWSSGGEAWGRSLTPTAVQISWRPCLDFPDSSGDSIPGLGRFPGEGIGYPLHYPWASLVAQLVKNPPTMRETWVWSLVWEDPWRRERLPTPIFWPREFHGLYSWTWGCKELDMTERLSLQTLFTSGLPFMCITSILSFFLLSTQLPAWQQHEPESSHQFLLLHPPFTLIFWGNRASAQQDAVWDPGSSLQLNSWAAINLVLLHLTTLQVVSWRELVSPPPSLHTSLSSLPLPVQASKIQ